LSTQLEIFSQQELFEEENQDYLTKQLITYIGNKRALLDFIGNGLNFVKKRLNKEKLKIFDVFSGSGIVARYFKKYSDLLIVNDLENYAGIINKCYLTNKSMISMEDLKCIFFELQEKLIEEKLVKGFIYEMYAPKNEKTVKEGERVFYTPRNAKYIDTARLLIENVESKYRDYFLAPLLSDASIHANTSGVFKGFYKDKNTGIGKFGGKNGDALFRILGNIYLQFPIFSNFECEVDIHRGDSNIIADCVNEVDIAYLDPPYNQHPYGSNYFMLNLIVDYIKPKNSSNISGIPIDWKRSNYNKRNNVYKAFLELVKKLKAKYLLISFNSEGFIKIEEMKNILKKIGELEILETKYNTFRGSRNLRNRDIHVKEYLYLVEKK